MEYELDFPDADCFMQVNRSMGEGNETTYELVYDVPLAAMLEIQLQEDITHGVTYTVQDMMETAVDDDSSLYFSVTYTGSDTGYFVRAVRGLKSNSDCMWFLYYRAPDSIYPFLKSKGVSVFAAEPNSTVVMRYQYPPVHQVYYEIYFPHDNCTDRSLPRPAPLNISLYFGAPNYTYTVQKVMELAVDSDPSYEFTVTYYGKSRGYEIDIINGTENADNCAWHFFYQLPRTPRAEATAEGNISYFHVDANATIIMSFQNKPKIEIEPSPVPEPSPSPSATPLPTMESPGSTTPMPAGTTPDSGSPIPVENITLLLLSLFVCLLYLL